ncbi:hypothetical protein HS088_TW03G00070 [Tripterygium wilfordii]|uniref:Cyanobacterial aminoacyl-tRNA synthetase CAAD domain-containing protein n=1 Tax=Tripterygium wilfordii TaxID=458696 RepID=A0A7J7DTQ0_TRIWF|nr:protein CURVATURE THYLAKOID 1D, chloroplastic-like isoform X2 [Tripterygium wilfordii]KAF5749745.1 hypothetical protein HS088_TW03G00070 [Tripterygium wilfordii]
MELCMSQAISNPPQTLQYNHHMILSVNSLPLRTSSQYLFPRRISVSQSALGLYSRNFCYIKSLPRATSSEETSTEANKYVGEERDGAIAVEDVSTVGKSVYNENLQPEVPKEESPVDEQMQSSDFLSKLEIKLNSEDSYAFLIYGGGAALVALWLASAIVGSIDSIPVFPKLMEVVGLGYTVWFGTRYLIFKNNRDELVAKMEELKQQVFGPDDN